MEWQAVQAKTVMDEASKEVKFSKQRVTDLPTCRRIEVPEAREDDTEVVFANMKTRLSKVTESYIKEKCDNKGNIKEQNVGKTGVRWVEEPEEKGWRWRALGHTN